MTFRTVNSSSRNKVRRGAYTLPMTTIGIVFFFLFTCISGYVKVWLEWVQPPVDVSTSGLSGWRPLWSVQIFIGLRQSEGGGGRVPFQARVWFWRQREEQERSCIRGAGGTQILGGEVEVVQLGQRVGPLQLGGHGQARQANAGFDLLRPLSHQAGLPPHAVQAVAAGAARQGGAVGRGVGREELGPYHPQQGFIGHQWL